MISPKINQLTEAKANVARLEISITEELASLPAAYGFESVETFIAAVKAAGRGRAGRRWKPVARKVRRRAKITDAVRAKVGKLVKSGKTGSQIAKTLKISLPSVQNVKKALGLVKTSKKPAPKAKPKARRASAKRPVPPKARKKRVAPEKPAASESKPAQASAEATPSPSA
jgi:hypothetical protein